MRACWRACAGESPFGFSAPATAANGPCEVSAVRLAQAASSGSSAARSSTRAFSQPDLTLSATATLSVVLGQLDLLGVRGFNPGPATLLDITADSNVAAGELLQRQADARKTRLVSF